MSPVIEISEGTFRRLQELAVPFVDTPETVIIRALDQMHGDGKHIPQFKSPPETTGLPPGARILDPENVSELSHTKLLEGRFASRNARNWNDLLIQAHAEAKERLGSYSAVKRISPSALSEGKKDDSGFHFQRELGMSIQYVDANKAWHQILALAKALGVATETQFRWREKDGAIFPGEYGVLRWTPSR